jgi:hypothetical protein
MPVIERVLGWGLGVPSALLGFALTAFALTARVSTRLTAAQLRGLLVTGVLFAVCGVGACSRRRWATIVLAVFYCLLGMTVLYELPKDYLSMANWSEANRRWLTFTVVMVPFAMSLILLVAYARMGWQWIRLRRRMRLGRRES